MVSKLGQVNYEMEVNGKVNGKFWKRHVDQLMIYIGASRPNYNSDLV